MWDERGHIVESTTYYYFDMKKPTTIRPKIKESVGSKVSLKGRWDYNRNNRSKLYTPVTPNLFALLDGF